MSSLGGQHSPFLAGDCEACLTAPNDLCPPQGMNVNKKKGRGFVQYLTDFLVACWVGRLLRGEETRVSPAEWPGLSRDSCCRE